MDNKIINGVWTGDKPLTNIQRLCINSYIDNDHEFHLWCSDPIGLSVPISTIIRRTEEIMPAHAPKFAGENYFSDYFRVVLINQVGGWYVDLDTVNLRYFDFPDNYAFVSESRLGPMKGWQEEITPPSNQVQEYLSGCIFKAPAGAPFLKYIIERIENMDTLHPKDWICMGPELFQEAIPKFALQKYVKPPSVFDALNYNELELFVTGMSGEWTFPPEALAIHLRTSFWQEKYHPILKPNGLFSPDSLYEKLKSRFGVISD